MSVNLIPKYRKKLNELLERKNRARAAVEQLLSINAVYTSEMCDYAAGDVAHWSNRDSVVERWYDLTGHEIPVVEAEFITGITSSTTMGNNMEYYFHELPSLLKAVPLVMGSDKIPSAEGWTNEEIEIVIHSYTSRIGKHNLDLRDAHTMWKKIARSKKPIPGFVKTKCLGMFGRPDWESRHVYSDADFKSSYYERDHLPSVLSAKYLAPLIGEEKADLIEGLIGVLEGETKPLPGEPDTLDTTGSHLSNKIPLESLAW